MQDITGDSIILFIGAICWSSSDTWAMNKIISVKGLQSLGIKMTPEQQTECIRELQELAIAMQKEITGMSAVISACQGQITELVENQTKFAKALQRHTALSDYCPHTHT